MTAPGTWRPAPKVIRTYRQAEPGTTPPKPANDPEYERTQPIYSEDRAQMLRSYFRSKDLSESKIDSALKARD